LVGVGEMLADVAHGGGTQEGIAQGMQRDIAIGVGGQTLIELDGHAAEHQLPALGKAVGVVTLSYS